MYIMRKNGSYLDEIFRDKFMKKNCLDLFKIPSSYTFINMSVTGFSFENKILCVKKIKSFWRKIILFELIKG